MNKTQLVDAVAERIDGDRKYAAAAVEAVTDLITRGVQKGEKVSITGFGVFEKRVRAARTARNPATGEPVKLKRTSVPAFRAGQNFKEVVSGAKKLPKVTVPRTPAASASTRSAPAKSTRSAAAKTSAAGFRGTSTKAAAKSSTSATTKASSRAGKRAAKK